MVALPLRGAAPLISTATCTVPLPLPFAPAAIVSHGTPDDAVHPQPDGAVTATLVVPAAAPTVTCSGVIAKLQDSAWVTTNGRPPIVSVPCRDAPVWAAAVKP